MKNYKRLTDSETAVMLTNTEGSSWDSEDMEAQRYIRLAELEDDLESGKMIRLPCKVGDTVFVIWKYSDFLGQEDEPFIEEDICKSFIYDTNKMKIIPENYGERREYWYTVLDILLTREEAEKKLEELIKSEE